MARNIDLLRLEMATLWERDAFGRLRAHPLVALAEADDGVAVRFCPSLPFGLRQSLEKVPIDERTSSVTLAEYQSVMQSSLPLETYGGASYVFPEAGVDIRATDLQIATSAEAVSVALRAARPEAWWEPDEWDDLLAGRLGPWAVGMIGDRIVSICHTPVGSMVAAEAGVWTHPEARGRGYAAAVTAAWAGVASRQFETLFYSTSADNAASQAVARKLGLAPIGWIWQIKRADL